MQPRGALVVLLVVLTLVVGPALVYATTGVDQGSAVTGESDVTQTKGDNASEGTFGSRMSAFMQSSAAATNDSVEAETWVRSVDKNMSTAAQQVKQRTDHLEDRLQRLEKELDRLEDSDLNVNNPATAGEIARLTTRVRSLQRSIDETERVADRAGANATRLDGLRMNAANLSGHEVASAARNLSLGPPAGIPGGPSVDIPEKPSDNDTTGPPKEWPGGPPNNDNETGPPNNDDETGPSADRLGGPFDYSTGPADGDLE